VVSFTPHPPPPHGNDPRYPLDGRLGVVEKRNSLVRAKNRKLMSQTPSPLQTELQKKLIADSSIQWAIFERVRLQVCRQTSLSICFTTRPSKIQHMYCIIPVVSRFCAFQIFQNNVLRCISNKFGSVEVIEVRVC
jgi:hypothetical protein